MTENKFTGLRNTGASFIKNYFVSGDKTLRLRHIAGLFYLLVLMAAVSLYVSKKGYLTIGEDKYRIFNIISTAGIKIWTALRIWDFVRQREWKRIRDKLKAIDYRKAFVLLFLLSGIISTLCSSYMHQSVQGSPGWYMGLRTQAQMVFTYFIAADITENINRRALKVIGLYALIVSGMVFVLGIMNRFSIFPFKIRGHEEEFISTLGNINWFCGYWSLWTGLGCGIFMKMRDRRRTLIAGVYIWICAMAGVSCGADSAYLSWGIISAVAFVMALEKGEYIRQWAVMEMIAATAFPCMRIIGALRPNRMWYGVWLKELTYGRGWVIPFAVATVVCVAVAFGGDFLSRRRSLIRSLLAGTAGAVVLGGVLLLMLNNMISGGIWPVRGSALFTVGESWGNGRGAIWKAAFMALRRTPVMGMFFGVGCDCFGSYIYSYDTIALLLRMRLGNNLLAANAHNELLNLVVNQGIFGVFAYMGILISHVREALREAAWEKEPVVWGIVLGMSAYFAIGMIGFMNILSTPFLFLLLGVMAGLTKRQALNRMI